MVWVSENYIQSHVALDMLQIDEAWVFRDSKSAFCFGKGLSELKWEHALDGDMELGPKELVRAENKVLTFLYDSDKKQPKPVLCICPVSGQVIWSHLSTVVSRKSISSYGKKIFISGFLEGKGHQFLIVNAQDGRTLATQPSISPRGIHANKNRIFVIGNKQIQVFDHSGETALTLDTEETSFCLGADGQIYFYFKESKSRSYYISCWQEDSIQESFRCVTDIQAGWDIRLTTTFNPRELFMYNKGVKVLSLVDLGKKQSIWDIDLSVKVFRLVQVLDTHHGYVALMKGEHSFLRLIDKKTGELKPGPSLKGQFVSLLFYQDDRLITSGISGIESFYWSS